VKHTHRMLALAAAAILAVGTLLPAAAAAMDADELIARHLEATGGAEKLKSVDARKASGKVMVQGMEIPFSMTSKRPNQLRIEASVMGMNMIQCFDGAHGWSINPMTGSMDAQPMSEIEEKGFRLQADMDGAFVDYKKKGYTVEYLGEDDVEGTPAYKLRLDTQQDIVMDLFFDTEYFMLIRQDSKITIDGNVIESQTYMGDFRDVDGIIIPFSIEARQGDVVNTQIVLDAVESNLELADDLFVMPEPAAAPAAPEGQ
jgi:outer membrane lipoprotein-sorting protein